MEYFKSECELYKEKLKDYSVEPIKPDEVPGFLRVDKFNVPKNKRSKRITQVRSIWIMEGSKILELERKQLKASKGNRKLKEDKELKKASERDIFLSGKKQCVFTNNKCLASG